MRFVELEAPNGNVVYVNPAAVAAVLSPGRATDPPTSLVCLLGGEDEGDFIVCGNPATVAARLEGVENRRILALLRRYGGHTEDCTAGQRTRAFACSCGWDEVESEG